MWLEQLKRRMGLSRKKPAGRVGSGQRAKTQLGIENLEDRTVPAVYKVLSLADNTGAVITAGHAGTAQDPFLAPSLRSAISAANATPGADTIQLAVAGKYKITLAGANEDNNATGDFDILAAGGDLKIVNISGGNAIIDGNHLDRVFDINPNPDPATPKFTVTLSHLTVQNGYVNTPDNPTGSGGGIRDSGNASLTLNSDVIQNNTSTQDGGGIVFENTVSTPWTLTLNATTIRNNHAGDAGGGIDTDGSGFVNINAGSVITGNTTVNQGGGIWLDAVQAVGANGTLFQTATLNVTGATISNNHSGATGGGIGNAGMGAVTITDSTLSGNQTLGNGGGYGSENGQDTLTVQNTLFLGNSAAGNGGGVFEGGPNATIRSSTFRDNSAQEGGGLFADTPTTLLLTNDLFTQNIAAVQGGGLEADGPLTTGLNLEFLDNDAGTAGGGMEFMGTTLNLTGVTFAENSSNGTGGGLEFNGSGNGPQESHITNATFFGNSALGGTGGGIDFPDSLGGLLLINDTISGNLATGAGGGVYWAGNDQSVFFTENSIFAGNSGGTGGDVVNPAGTIEDVGGNVVGNSAGSNGFTNQATQLNVDPHLDSLDNNGGPQVGSSGDSMTLETQALLAGSPATGRGVNVFLTPGTDERGFLRNSFAQGNSIDAGAFEFAGLASVVHSTVPFNGDTNPYGVLFIPPTFPTGGLIRPGNLLVSNFNNAAGTQGLGTTLVRITAAGAATTVFTSQQTGLSAALGVLKAGYVIVGNVPNVNGTPQAGGLQIINKNGKVISKITDSTLLNGPWYLTVANDTGNTAQVFVSNVLSGTVTRLDLQIQHGSVKVVARTQIASGYGHRLDAAAFVVGPAGLVYDAAHDTLYVASSADNAIYKIANASTTTTDGGMGTLVTNNSSFLHGPLGLFIAPNGNLLVANSDAQNADPNNPSELSEFSTAGQFISQIPLDPANGGAFGVSVNTANGHFILAAVDDNTNTITTWSV